MGRLEAFQVVQANIISRSFEPVAIVENSIRHQCVWRGSSAAARFSRAGLNHAVASWSRWKFVRWSSPQLPVVERKPLVLKASEFQHLFEEGLTEKVYANTVHQ